MWNCWIIEYFWASLVAHLVKNLPAMQKTLTQFLGQENPLEEGMATHFCILVWRIHMDRGAWEATVHGVAKSRTWLRTVQNGSIFFFKETSYSFIVDASIYISAESSLFPTSSPALVVFCLLIIAFLTSVFFIFISLNKWCWAPFHISHLYVFSEKKICSDSLPTF